MCKQNKLKQQHTLTMKSWTDLVFDWLAILISESEFEIESGNAS